MTLDEADKIIAELSIVFPQRKLVVEEVFRWEQNLLPFLYEDARETVRLIERSSSFFPAWADFYKTVSPIALRNRNNAQALELESAPEDRPCTPEENLEQIAKIKEIIKNLNRRFSD